jgi:hypothetical protein
MRCAPDSLSKESPFLRVFGRQPVTKVNIWFGQPEEQLGTVDQTIQPWQPDDQVENDDGPIIMEEDQDKVVIQQTTPAGEPFTQKYQKIRPEDPEEEPHLAAIFNIQDEAQARKDSATAKRHETNKRVFKKKKQPEFYSPVCGELIDWHAPFDEDSKFSRKLAIRWRGPYRVMTKPNHAYTVEIATLDPTTLNLTGERPRQVYVGDTRPSTIIRLRERPRGDWKPPWVHQRESASSESETKTTKETKDD